MYKLVVIDFDDTLFDDNLKVSNRNLEAMKKAMDKGVTILFSSGRSDKSMEKVVRSVGIHGVDDFYSCYNGAIIKSLSGREIYRRVLKKDQLEDLINMGKRYNVDVQCYQEELLVEEFTELTQKYVNLVKTGHQLIDDLTTLDYSIKVLYISENKDILAKLKAEVESKYGETNNIFYSKPTYVEVLHKGASKGASAAYVAGLLGIQQEEVIAIGDSYNDHAMIEYAGLGVAVKNAREDIKKIADYVTENDNNHDAVAEVIEKFVLVDHQPMCMC